MKKLARYVVGIGLLALVLRTEISYGVVVALGLLWLMSIALPKLATRQVTTQRRQPERVFHGESINVQLDVHNRGPLPVPWIEIADRAPLDLAGQGPGSERRHVISLGPGEARRIDYQLSAARRGYHRVGPATVQAGDWLGAFRGRLADIRGTPIIVYPKILPIAGSSMPSRAPYVSQRQPMSLQRDTNRIIGVRQYEPGDPLRSIHWPSTAATGTTLVKQYQPADARDLVLSVDLGRNGYPQSRRFVGPEMAITAAASVANHAITVEDQPVGLFLRGLDAATGVVSEIYLPPKRTRAHLMLVLEMLARFQTVPRLDYPDALSRLAGRLPWAATLLVCVGDSRAELGQVLHSLRTRGVAPSMVITGARTDPTPDRVPARMVARETDIRRL